MFLTITIATNNKSNNLNNKENRSRAFIKIQDGCNFSCSYCAIHLARGKSRSIDRQVVINEIQRASENGLNEVVLTGVHIGLYGSDLRPKSTLTGLIKDLLKKTTMPRIRLSSLEISEINDEMLELLADKRICKHLHIPLQSGDKTVLKLMARPYTPDTFMSKMTQIVSKYHDISIGSDVIVGFPGESETCFESTVQFIEDLDFSYLHIFPYSKRENTQAVMMPGHVSSDIINRRAAILRTIAKKKKMSYMNRFLGNSLDVIVEAKRGSARYSSTSGNYLKVMLESKELVPASLVMAHITGIAEDSLIGVS